MKQSAEKGAHNFIARIVNVAVASGFEVEYRPNTAGERAASANLPGYAMFHMNEPTHDRAMTMRRVYYYPFWQIERSGKRWEWRVAHAQFDAAQIDQAEAQRFFTFWRKRLFGEVGEVGSGGLVYVPLQGRLTEHRSFQTCSPIEMIEAVLEHDPNRRVVATLHPGESYTDREIATLERLEKQHSRLQIESGQMEKWLAACDYVVTQNSSAAFAGFFFQKPCITFARIDFHHISAHVPNLGRAKAFAQVLGDAPDYAAYIWWFLQEMSINAGRPEAEAKINAALLRGGWPM